MQNIPNNESQKERTYTKDEAVKKLLEEIDEGRKSGEEDGWLTLEEVKRDLGYYEK